MKSGLFPSHYTTPSGRFPPWTPSSPLPAGPHVLPLHKALRVVVHRVKQHLLRSRLHNFRQRQSGNPSSLPQARAADNRPSGNPPTSRDRFPPSARRTGHSGNFQRRMANRHRITSRNASARTRVHADPKHRPPSVCQNANCFAVSHSTVGDVKMLHNPTRGVLNAAC